MKKIFGRFKLSQYLLVSQVLVSVLTLISYVYFDKFVDYIGLAWNIINGIALLIAYFFENKQSIKYHELTAQYIFYKLADSFSGFLDFVMSNGYENKTVEEHVFFQDKIEDYARNGNYEIKRKIARALPNLYDIDKRMTRDIINVLRKDIFQGNVDIRRRTLESILTIIQKGDTIKEKKKRFKMLENNIKYLKDDDNYVVVAILENLFYLSRFVYVKEKEKHFITEKIENLKKNVKTAFEKKSADIDENLDEVLNVIIEVLISLSDVGSGQSKSQITSTKLIQDILTSDKKFAKLAVVKNLFYTCNEYPNCLCTNKCNSYTSTFMLKMIYDFLTASEDNIFLIMPTVRYFDCVCNNVHKSEARKLAKNIILEYFTNENLLINQTAFDKFTKLISLDRDFAREIINDLLDSLYDRIDKNANEIANLIGTLSEDKAKFYIVKKGRLKYKMNDNLNYHEKITRHRDEELCMIDSAIEQNNTMLKFIGEIKKMKDDNSL